EPEAFDMPLGERTGAGVIFGVTGGVMEAALRLAVEKLAGHSLSDKEIEFTDVRGSTGIKEATLKVADKEINVCIVHGLANAHKVCQEVAAGKSKYHFIEVMTCPGGCVNGGGQPIDFNAYEKIERRTAGLYKADKDLPRRKSQDNPAIIETYKKVLPEGPCAEKSHHLLHTKYAKRGNFR
ncbi:MAG: iron hydrogenase small subunit, partial [Candidatus Riflebacteria bacterium]|nr:iron hydrogenase small subunit [Candidatus Riflebacteria bacterium]